MSVYCTGVQRAALGDDRPRYLLHTTAIRHRIKSAISHSFDRRSFFFRPRCTTCIRAVHIQNITYPAVQIVRTSGQAIEKTKTRASLPCSSVWREDQGPLETKGCDGWMMNVWMESSSHHRALAFFSLTPWKHMERKKERRNFQTHACGRYAASPLDLNECMYVQYDAVRSSWSLCRGFHNIPSRSWHGTVLRPPPQPFLSSVSILLRIDDRQCTVECSCLALPFFSLSRASPRLSPCRYCLVFPTRALSLAQRVCRRFFLFVPPSCRRCCSRRVPTLY